MELFEELPLGPPPRLYRESHFVYLGRIVAINQNINEVWIQKNNQEIEIIHYTEIQNWEITDKIYYYYQGNNIMYWNFKTEPE